MDAMRDNSATYRMASLFLLVIFLTSIAVIWNRHTEMNVALNKSLSCTQQILSLTKECGMGQLKELKELRDENKKLILMQGECLVYRKNVNTTTSTSLSTEKHMDHLVDMIKTRDKLALSEGEQKEESVKLLKSCIDEANQLREKLQEIVSEKDRLIKRDAKCSDELTACQQASG